MTHRLGLVVVAILLAACGRAPVPPGYDFVTHSLPGGSGMAALFEGGLVIGHDDAADAWCLLVVAGSRNVTYVAWPEHFTLVLPANGKFEVHGDGRVLRQGDEVRLGGGEITQGLHHSIEGACDSALPFFAVQSLP